MTIVMLGSDGQIGWELGRTLAPLGRVVAPSRRPETAQGDPCGDLEKPNELRRTLRGLRPEVIVNAAAYTDVDRAETDPARARRVNAEGPAVLAREAKRLGALLIHYSTDYIFDGSGTTPWREDDRASPLNVYGRTKWEGEQAVRDAGCRHVILRTQWVYSSRRRNFVRTILRLAAERDALQVTDAEIGAPTSAALVAEVTARVVRASTAAPGSDTYTSDYAAGTYHVAARGETSRYAYACFLVDSARRAGWPLRLTPSGIAPVEPARSGAIARRPRNTRLSVDRLERTFGLRMPDWRVGIEHVLAQMSEQGPAAGNGRGEGPEREPHDARIL